MHAVNIGICGNYHIVVSEVLQPVFNIQGCLKQVELFVFVYDLFERPYVFRGLPLRLKTAWVSTFLALVMEPEAESPSVINRVDSSRRLSEVL